MLNLADNYFKTIAASLVARSLEFGVSLLILKGELGKGDLNLKVGSGCVEGSIRLADGDSSCKRGSDLYYCMLTRLL